MSLINEALKQAERDRQNPSDRAIRQPVPSSRPARTKWPWRKHLKVTIASAVVLAAAGGWILLQAWGKLPASAEAVGTAMETPDLEQLEATLGRTHAAVKDTQRTPQPGTPNVRAAKAVSSRPSPSARRGDFDLKGIFHGAGGARAIINGRLVRRGQKIGKATVIQIGTNTVELEMHGLRITLRI